jgi:hypothetical protein
MPAIRPPPAHHHTELQRIEEMWDAGLQVHSPDTAEGSIVLLFSVIPFARPDSILLDSMTQPSAEGFARA